MAVTVQTVRTAISRNTAAENTYAFSLSSNATAGATLVLVVTADNSASGGATNNINQVTDTANNTWTKRQSPLFDNGAANAGIQGAWFDTNQANGTLTTGSTITIAFSSTTTVARAVVVYQITPETNGVIEYVTGNVGTGAAAANGQITTDTVQPGQVVFAAYHSENVNAVTGDSDTTNGTWATQETTTVGTTTSGIRHSSQYKIQTTAASTQSYDVTVNSQDRIVSYVLYKQFFQKTLTASAVIKATVSPTGPTADAIVSKTQTFTATADAEVAVAVTTVPGDFTASAVILRAQEASATADAIVKTTVGGSATADSTVLRTYTQTATADAIALRAQTGDVSADATVQATIAGSASADAVISAQATFTFEADATIKATTETTFTADAEIAAVVTSPVWTTPVDLAPISTTPTLAFNTPTLPGDMHFHIQLDKVETFDGPDLRNVKSNFDQTGWEYWDGDSWEPVPASGMPSAFGGNEARYTVSSPLSSGTWYRRVRAG